MDLPSWKNLFPGNIRSLTPLAFGIFSWCSASGLCRYECANFFLDPFSMEINDIIVPAVRKLLQAAVTHEIQRLLPGKLNGNDIIIYTMEKDGRCPGLTGPEVCLKFMPD